MPAVISKSFILDEIRRTAAENGGQPLGVARFERETGIRPNDWQGIHWARWGDALVEAGFAPNQMQSAINTSDLVRCYAGLAKELGHLPVRAELQLKRRSDSTFPNHTSLVQRFGSKRALVGAVAEYCKSNPAYDDVLDWCIEYLERGGRPADNNSVEPAQTEFGSVYLAKAGRYYKIGKSNAAGRREYEIGLRLPETLTMIHVIPTDDPGGIEAYWHKRFDSKRKNGEWFDLDRADVSAFKRRKFM